MLEVVIRQGNMEGYEGRITWFYCPLCVHRIPENLQEDFVVEKAKRHILDFHGVNEDVVTFFIEYAGGRTQV